MRQSPLAPTLAPATPKPNTPTPLPTSPRRYGLFLRLTANGWPRCYRRNNRGRGQGCTVTRFEGGALLSIAYQRQRLADLRAALDAKRIAAGRPLWQPGMPERWPVYSTLHEVDLQLTEAEERSNEMRQTATPIDQLSPVQEKALAALLVGKSISETATAAGVDRTTVHRWLKEDVGFQAAVNREKHRLREALRLRLMALADRATECVERSISAGDEKAALALLKGLGLLTGEPLSIGSDDPADLADAAAESELCRRLANHRERT